MKYPKECPVVEWIDKRDNLFPRGELFEVVELYERYDYGTGIKFYRCFHRTSTGKTGLYGIWSLAMNQIRPLTPAARAMLAIAKGRRQVTPFDEGWIATPTVNPISWVEWANDMWLVYYWGFRVGSVIVGKESAFFRSVTGNGRLYPNLTDLVMMLDRVAAQAGMLSDAMMKEKAAA